MVKWRAPIDHPTSDWIGTRHLVSAEYSALLFWVLQACGACILGAAVRSAVAEL